MQNYYEALGVGHDVTPAIAKIAYEGKVKALERAALSESDRNAERDLLAKAYATLSNPAKKEWYDKQRAQWGEREHHEAAKSHRAGWFVAGALALVLAAGIGYYMVSRANEKERIRLEESRIALEREKAQRAAELEQARLELQQASEQQRQEMEARRQASRDRSYMDREGRIAEDRAYQQQVRERALNTFDKVSKQVDEDRQRRLAEDERRKAQALVERQKRFVAEREREEERIRADKHYRAQQEAAAARARDLALKRDR